MGGNALRTVETIRLSKLDYAALAERALTELDAAWPLARPHLVRSYRAKPDYGDMDVVVDAEGVPADVAAELRRLFQSTEVVHNGSVWSCDVDGFQLDVLCMPSGDYETACDYFAYNDLGNLMGRVSRRMGFKYGHDGLSWQLRDGDQLVANVEVSKDMPKVFAFLGYDQPAADYATFENGFESLLDVFRFVTTSPWFDPTAYALESRNHTARIRDRKRPSYRTFLEWLERERVPAGARAGETPDCHLVRAMREFPQFTQRLHDAQLGHEAAKNRRARFNGQMAARLTGLAGKALGAFMAHVRNGYPGGRVAFDAWLDTGPSEQDVAVHLRREFERTCQEPNGDRHEA